MGKGECTILIRRVCGAVKVRDMISTGGENALFFGYEKEFFQRLFQATGIRIVAGGAVAAFWRLDANADCFLVIACVVAAGR